MKSVLVVLVVCVAVVISSCALSEASWAVAFRSPQPLLKVTGLPSIAFGDLSNAARSPGLEMLATCFYDEPGAYCQYFTPGTPLVNFTGVRIIGAAGQTP